ncbi:hypothetical protein [[Kitasatospora] papulosa]|uniref:hypothetical protein n=1 Tax=[Kitasatospora] papulosa TaxID=1464011 RepID=UPI00368265C0
MARRDTPQADPVVTGITSVTGITPVSVSVSVSVVVSCGSGFGIGRTGIAAGTRPGPVLPGA